MIWQPTRREFLHDAALGLTVATAGFPMFPLFPGDADQDGDNPYGGYRAQPDTPADGAGRECDPTGEDILGPFYREGAPWTNALANEEEAGRRLVVSGQVLDTDCRPIGGATLDVWQATADGHYDNDDPRRPPAADFFRLRGRIRADAEGRYEVRTVWPGAYDIGGGQRRPSHVHYKVVADGFRDLVTQMYFRGDPNNATDRWYRASRAIEPAQDEAGAWRGTFRIVLATAS